MMVAIEPDNIVNIYDYDNRHISIKREALPQLNLELGVLKRHKLGLTISFDSLTLVLAKRGCRKDDLIVIKIPGRFVVFRRGSIGQLRSLLKKTEKILEGVLYGK